MKQNKIIIGLLGGSGCGKSIVAKAASDLGFKHIDTDIIGHDIILKPEESYYKIIEKFGTEILDKDGEINRKRLGNIVFSDKSMLDALSDITHPAITDRVVSMLDDRTIIDGAVLYRATELFDMCDYIIAVTNSDERRVKFICNRDNVDESTALRRIKSQPDNAFYVSVADYVIDSDCDIDEFYNKSVDIIKRCIGA